MNALTCPPCHGRCAQGRTCPARAHLTERVAQMATTATGLRIGIAYQPALAGLDGDSQRLQSALLEPRTRQEPSLTARVLSAVWRWL